MFFFGYGLWEKLQVSTLTFHTEYKWDLTQSSECFSLSLEENGGGINLFRINSNRSIYIARAHFIHLRKAIAEDYEQVVSRTLHVDFGCSVELSFSNMKNKKHFHIDLHLVHSPNAFKSHHCHVRTTVYSILLYHNLFSLQYRLPYYFNFFRFYDLHWSFEAA